MLAQLNELLLIDKKCSNNKFLLEVSKNIPMVVYGDKDNIKKLIIYANLYGYSLDYLFGIKWRNENYSPIIVNKFSIGENLRKLRIKNNDTESSLALKLNTTQSTVSNWERGKTIISTTFIVGLTKVYDNFSIDKLFNRIKDNNKNNLRF
mgnify:CR=1 FL=1